MPLLGKLVPQPICAVPESSTFVLGQVSRQQETPNASNPLSGWFLLVGRCILVLHFHFSSPLLYLLLLFIADVIPGSVFKGFPLHFAHADAEAIGVP